MSSTQKPSEVSRPVSINELPQLFGTVIMKEKKFAILEDQSTKKSNLYKVNDSVSGCIVSQILEDKVILSKDGESIEIGLRAEKKFRPPTKRTPTRKRAVRKAPQRRRPTERVRRNKLPRRRPPARGSGDR